MAGGQWTELQKIDDFNTKISAIMALSRYDPDFGYDEYGREGSQGSQFEYSRQDSGYSQHEPGYQPGTGLEGCNQVLDSKDTTRDRTRRV